MRTYFMRCNPQDCDIIDLVYRHGRTFVGYPAWKTDDHRDCLDFGGACLDISLPASEWDSYRFDADSNYRRGISTNRRFALEIAPGSVVVIPRREQGVWHIATIAGRFEFVRQPPWADEYLALRRRNGLSTADERSHIGDVVYTWPNNAPRPVPYSHVPEWLSRSLRRPVQIGAIKDHPETGQSAAETLLNLV